MGGGGVHYGLTVSYAAAVDEGVADETFRLLAPAVNTNNSTDWSAVVGNSGR